MSRPLQFATAIELTRMAERNWNNKAELELIQSELRHRNTSAASKLRLRVEMWLADCEKPLNVTPRSEPKKQPSESVPKPSMIDPQVREWTDTAVAKLRAKLIDLSRRSPLIAFKHVSRSVNQLRFVDERPDLLFEQLVRGSMGFEPLPGEEQTPADERTPAFGIAYERARLTDPVFLAETEKLGDTDNDARAWQDAERGLRSRVRAQLGLPKLDYGKGLDLTALARAHGFDPSYDLKPSDDGDISAHHEDDAIRVLLTRKELDRRLKSIEDKATSHLRETGHHTLHLAFGFVQWFEDDTSDILSHAPLLLLPVKLAKDEGRAKKDYRLSIWEGGLEVNVALIEKAREHWGIDLPALREDETPESYFVRVNAVLGLRQRLTLRTFVTLCVLPPMILWRDLDPARWPEDAFCEHRLLPGLVGAAEVSGVDGDDTILDIDDPINDAVVPALITDADASQHRAIMDMAAGRDMAIEGPPGTGKSQTITNMIATALSQGKRVLFVAEKQAALRVVSDRLRASGFGALLLELHGDKASRTDVYAGVRERLEAQPWMDGRTVDEKRIELRRHRDLLRRYLSLVRAPLGKLGRTAHALAWREIRLRQLFTRDQIAAVEKRWATKDISNLDVPTLGQNRELLKQFGKALLAIEPGRDRPRTRWIFAARLDPFDQRMALSTAAAAGQSAAILADTASALTAPTPDAIMHFAGFANRMRGFGPFNVQMIYAQRPGAGLVASRREWEAQGRTVRPGAIPILVLRPMGPIDYVFEELDTDPPTQRDPTRDVFAACGELNPERLDRLIEALAKPTKRHLLVHIQRRPTGASLAGWIVGGPLVPVDEVPSGYKEVMGPIWNVSINERLTPAEQFVTLLHELGHLFCGHLGPFSDSNLNADEFGWPDRRHLPRVTMEIEAELVAWWLANREGLTTGSPLYLRPYLEQAGSAVAKVDLDRVTRAVARVRGYLGGKP